MSAANGVDAATDAANDCFPPDQIPVIRVPAMPAHTTAGGDVFGGWIMSQIDIAGSVPAIKRAKGWVVTVAVKGMRFLRPVYPGDLVSLFAQVVRVGNTSMEVAVEVFVERDPDDPKCLRVAEAELVYVAVDPEGQPRTVPAAD
jgi:acyl-CoA thioesterase YciA